MEQIKKIAANNIEVRKSRTETDINNVEIEVWGDPESYGQERIDEEKKVAQEELTVAQNIDVVIYKQDLITEAQSKIDRLNLIQTEMDE